jgi:hypothetical protein
MADEHVTIDEPHDHLTEIAGLALGKIEPEVKREGLRAIVLVVDPGVNPKRVGTGFEGYEEPAEAFFDLYAQLKALGAVMGTEVVIAPLHQG